MSTRRIGARGEARLTGIGSIELTAPPAQPFQRLARRIGDFASMVTEALDCGQRFPRSTQLDAAVTSPRETRLSSTSVSDGLPVALRCHGRGCRDAQRRLRARRCPQA